MKSRNRSDRFPRSRAKRKLLMEGLESRLMMDGNVSVGISGGNLSILGDGLSNTVDIAEVSPGQ